MTATSGIEHGRERNSDAWTGASADDTGAEVEAKFNRWLEAKPYRNVLLVCACIGIIAGLSASEKIDWSKGFSGGLLMLFLSVVGTVVILTGWFAGTFELAKKLLSQSLKSGRTTAGIAIYYSTFGISFVALLFFFRAVSVAGGFR